MLLAFSMASCDNDPVKKNEPATGNEARPADDRDKWQRPDALLAVMGDLHGRTVADLFAGDGYFTFQLIEAGANVIAIVSDPNEARALQDRKAEAGLDDQRLQIRSVNGPEPGLNAGEADVALIVHSYAKIPDRMAYLVKLREGLKDPKQLFLVEWQKRPTPMGPPLEQRMATDQMMEELGMAGFSGVGARADNMPYQVVLIAMDQAEITEEEYQRQMEGKHAHPI